MRAIRLMLGSILLMLPAPVFAQADFSGNWELISSAGADVLAPVLSPLRSGGRIIQNDKAITMEPSKPSNPGAPPYVYPFGVSLAATRPNDSPIWPWATEARWVTPATLLITAHVGWVTGRWWTRVMTLSLNEKGQLEIVVVEPLVWPENRATTLRLVYQKK